MSYSFKLLSHPSSKSNPSTPHLLVDHLREVGDGARELISSLDIHDFSIYGENISKSQLEKLAYIIGISHDFGKGTSFFQKHLQTHSQKEESRHAPISALFAFRVSSIILKSPLLSYIAFLTVYYHHGDLTRPAESAQRLDARQIDIAKRQATDILNGSYYEIREIYESLSPGLSPVIIEFLRDDGITSARVEMVRYIAEITGDGKPLIDAYFLVMLMYSALLHADKMSASGMGYENAVVDRESFGVITRELVDRYRETLKDSAKRNPELLSLRALSYSDALTSSQSLDIWNNRMMRLELPTGLGKTTVALGVALEMRTRIQEKGFTPRIIYALPFITIIEQNFKVYKEILSQNTEFISMGDLPSSLLLQHHHLSDVYYTFHGEDRPSDIDSVDPSILSKRYLLMEGWDSEIIITTFVQLFHTLITNRNASSMKFHSLVNSIIILDEVQAIPYKYQQFAIEMLRRLTELFNSWVIMMTATMPDSFIQEGAINLIPDHMKYFDGVNRVVYRYVKNPINLEALAEYILKWGDKDVLVVVNTIKASKDLYALLKTSLSQRYGSSQWNYEGGYRDFGSTILTVLSTHIAPSDREKRVSTIKNLGKRKIVVSTQLIEAGVDIDMDIVIRDMSPIDSIVQAGGRANRESLKGKGKIMIINLLDEKGKSYARTVYDVTDLNQSKEILEKAFSKRGEEGGLFEKEFHEAVRSYYHHIANVKSDAASREFLNAIDFLDYSKVSEFKIIEDDPKVDVFIALDDHAKEIWNEYKNAMELPPLERRNKMLAFRNSFYRYVISVRKKAFEGAIDPVINPVASHEKKVEDFYDKEMGFVDGEYGQGSSYVER